MILRSFLLDKRFSFQKGQKRIYFGQAPLPVCETSSRTFCRTPPTWEQMLYIQQLETTNQPTNQPIIQSTKQPSNQPTKQPPRQPETYVIHAVGDNQSTQKIDKHVLETFCTYIQLINLAIFKHILIHKCLSFECYKCENVYLPLRTNLKYFLLYESSQSPFTTIK